MDSRLKPWAHPSATQHSKSLSLSDLLCIPPTSPWSMHPNNPQPYHHSLVSSTGLASAIELCSHGGCMSPWNAVTERHQGNHSCPRSEEKHGSRTHQGTQQVAYQGTHQVAHQATHQVAYQAKQQVAYQGTHQVAHQATHQVANQTNSGMLPCSEDVRSTEGHPSQNTKLCKNTDTSQLTSSQQPYTPSYLPALSSPRLCRNTHPSSTEPDGQCPKANTNKWGSGTPWSNTEHSSQKVEQSSLKAEHSFLKVEESSLKVEQASLNVEQSHKTNERHLRRTEAQAPALPEALTSSLGPWSLSTEANEHNEPNQHNVHNEPNWGFGKSSPWVHREHSSLEVAKPAQEAKELPMLFGVPLVAPDAP